MDEGARTELECRGSPARGFLLVFVFTSIWVYTIRSAAFLLVFNRLQEQFMAVGIFTYPVQLIGAWLLPAWIDKAFGMGWCATRHALAALLVGAFALMAGVPFAQGFVLPLILFYLMHLCVSTAMGLSMRRGALLWDPSRAALIVGGVYVLYNATELAQYYAFFGTQNPYFYLGIAFSLFGGLLIAALISGLRLRQDFTPEPRCAQPFPKDFVRVVVLVLALHAVFSTAVNTVWYFDNMDDFHTPSYELLFNLLALAVMSAAVWIYHKRRWFGPTLVCLLVLCLGQGLTLWEIENRPLAISYNLITMATKMPPFLLMLIAPAWYAMAMRKPGMMCLGFGISCAADFSLLLTQLRPGTLSVVPRQGALLLIGLVLTGMLVFLYIRFQKLQTDELLGAIRRSQSESRTPEQTLFSLNLTPREHEVAQLLLTGDSQKIIAAKLHISGATVGFHTKNLYRKLNIQSRSELFALFLAPLPGAALEEVGM